MTGRPRRWRNGEHGYGIVTKTLHWSVTVAILAQFIVGYLLDSRANGRGRGRGRSGESGRGDGYDVFGDDTLLTVHVMLGLTILVLATLRLTWRVWTPLPPWAPTLSGVERMLAHWTERMLYATMFAIPMTGLVLLAAGDDDAIGFHIAAHIGFFVAITAHVALVLKHQFVNRDQLLRRMT